MRSLVSIEQQSPRRSCDIPPLYNSYSHCHWCRFLRVTPIIRGILDRHVSRQDINPRILGFILQRPYLNLGLAWQIDTTIVISSLIVDLKGVRMSERFRTSEQVGDSLNRLRRRWRWVMPLVFDNFWAEKVEMWPPRIFVHVQDNDGEHFYQNKEKLSIILIQTYIQVGNG